jgi:uncharacterized membrane protein
VRALLQIERSAVPHWRITRHFRQAVNCAIRLPRLLVRTSLNSENSVAFPVGGESSAALIDTAVRTAQPAAWNLGEDRQLLTKGRALPQNSKLHETNIDTIVRLEAEQEERVSRTDRLSEAIGKFAGTNVFVLFQIAWVTAYIMINTGWPAPIFVFDPFPFPLLAVILGLEAVLLTAFVLIRQNRMSLKADQRSHLDLQINLLAEKEATKVIQLLQRISRHLGMEEQITDRELRELGKDTEVEDLARDLRKNLNEESEKTI